MAVWHVTDPNGTRHDITCLHAWEGRIINFDGADTFTEGCHCQHGIWIHPDHAKVQQAVDVLNRALELLDPDNKLGRPEDRRAGGGLITWEFGADAGRLLADWLEHARYGHMNQQRRLAQEADPLSQVMDALKDLADDHALRVIAAARARVEMLTPENL